MFSIFLANQSGFKIARFQLPRTTIVQSVTIGFICYAVARRGPPFGSSMPFLLGKIKGGAAELSVGLHHRPSLCTARSRLVASALERAGGQAVHQEFRTMIEKNSTGRMNMMPLAAISPSSQPASFMKSTTATGALAGSGSLVVAPSSTAASALIDDERLPPEKSTGHSCSRQEGLASAHVLHLDPDPVHRYVGLVRDAAGWPWNHHNRVVLDTGIGTGEVCPESAG